MTPLDVSDASFEEGRGSGGGATAAAAAVVVQGERYCEHAVSGDGGKGGDGGGGGGAGGVSKGEGVYLRVGGDGQPGSGIELEVSVGGGDSWWALSDDELV